jgi:hypothetical protein
MATPPDFTSGAVLTAAQMNSVGLWLVKSQAVGAGASNVVVTNAFSADFDNYKITLSGGTASGTANFSCIFGATISGGPYASTRIKNSPNNGTPVGNGLDSQNNFGYFGQGSTLGVNVNCDVSNPFLNQITTYFGSYMLVTGGGSELGTTQGFLNNSTSYTGFTITFGGQTVTGATLRVYGYRK